MTDVLEQMTQIYDLQVSSVYDRLEWTTSGKEAVFRSHMAIDENDPFKVYIIDWLMPDMNGVEVVRRIRKKIDDDVPIIILTAYSFVPEQNASP